MSLLPREDFLAQLRADDAPDCPICLEPADSTFTTTCGHKFCLTCIASELERRNKCPCCRNVLYQAHGTAQNNQTQVEVPTDDFRITRRPVAEEEVFKLHPYANVTFRSDQVLPYLNQLIVNRHHPPDDTALTYVNGLLDNEPQIIATWLWAKPRSRLHFLYHRSTNLSNLAQRDLIDNCVPQWEQIYFSARNTLDEFKDQCVPGSELKTALIDNARRRIGGMWPNYGETLTSGSHQCRLTADVKDFVSAIVAAAQDSYRETYQQPPRYFPRSGPDPRQEHIPQLPQAAAPQHRTRPLTDEELRMHVDRARMLRATFSMRW